MSLHTRFRPTDWDDVIGQDTIVSSLRNALAKKASQTFLLVGPSGTGKTTLARIAASKVGCDKSGLLEVDAATYTGIDDVRQITSTLHYRPMTGTTKVIIMDEIHMLSKNAFSALLKSIEDVPSWVYWFLCTTDAAKVPKNIKTRCTTYNFKPVSTSVLKELLQNIASKEKLKPIKGVIELCASEAEGSPRQAIVNLEVCANVKDKEEALELLESASESAEAIDLARLLMGKPNWRKVQELLSKMKQLNPESVRHVVRAYMTNVILAAKSESQAGSLMEVLDAFSTPFPSSDGISPLVLACGRIVLGE